MVYQTHRFLLRTGLAAGLTALSVSTALSWERVGFASYGGYASYAGPSVYGGPYRLGGDPAGAGYRGYDAGFVPRPVDLVPPAWGYGAYGVPSATGIRQAPAARPTVYVIGRPAARHRTTQSRALSRSPGGGWSEVDGSETRSGGARIVSVTGPHR